MLGRLFFGTCLLMILVGGILIGHGIAKAATFEVSFASVVRPTQNDDGSVYDPAPGSVVWQCSGAATVELVQPTAALTPDPINPAAVGTDLANIFAGQPDGNYTCVAREQSATNLRSLASNTSEQVEKRGAIFLVVRVVPNAPSVPTFQ